MIHVDNISYRYPDSNYGFALRGVSFVLRLGERVALMGSNGSGKTTLVCCLNGLYKPDEGDVVVDGLSVRNPENLFNIRKRVGMVFQNPDNQIVTTTVRREIAFGLENLGVDHAQMVERVETTLKKFHLTAYGDKPPHLLSGGERQRLALASVWVMKPNYFILDEPTSLLDPEGREDVLHFLDTEVQQNNTGVLLVTQYPEEALLCDRLIIMDRSKIVLEGPPSEVFQNTEMIRKIGLRIPLEIEWSDYLE